MKKVCLIVSIIALITCLSGVPYIIEGISTRGFGGVNYGRIIIPLLIAGISFLTFKKSNK